MGDIVARDLYLPEGPRWHAGAFWFSDIMGHKVHRLGPAGSVETIAQLEGQPSGLGWLPDGRLVVVSMKDQRLMRLEGGKLVQHADLSSAAIYWCNDMVVDRLGRAYVGCLGGPLAPDKPAPPAPLVFVDVDGRVSVAADDLIFPNGAALTGDGRGLIVAETAAHRLTRFDVDPSGALSGRRVLFEAPGMLPDGICVDSQDAVWAADPAGKQVLRVLPDGSVAARVELGDAIPLACALGGEDGRTLLVCVVPKLEFGGRHDEPHGWLEVFCVDAPAWPSHM